MTWEAAALLWNWDVDLRPSAFIIQMGRLGHAQHDWTVFVYRKKYKHKNFVGWNDCVLGRMHEENADGQMKILFKYIIHINRLWFIHEKITLSSLEFFLIIFMDGKANRTQQESIATVLKVITKWARYFWCLTPLNTLHGFHGSFVDFNVITSLFLRTNTVTSFVFTCKFDPFSNTELAFQIYVISHTFQVTPLKFDNFLPYDLFPTHTEDAHTM